MDADQDQNVIQQARALMAENFQQVVNVVLAHKAHITHSSPEHAERFAVLSVLSSIELIAF